MESKLLEQLNAEVRARLVDNYKIVCEREEVTTDEYSFDDYLTEIWAMAGTDIAEVTHFVLAQLEG